MKFSNKSGNYYASNCSFNPEHKTAWSYGWWQFLKVINKQLVFNSYRYSVTTGGHQRKVRSQMHECGLRIDRIVQVKGGLQNINSLKELNAAENETLELIAQNEEYKKQRRNERRKMQREAKKSSERALAQDAKRVLNLV